MEQNYEPFGRDANTEPELAAAAQHMQDEPPADPFTRHFPEAEPLMQHAKEDEAHAKEETPAEQHAKAETPAPALQAAAEKPRFVGIDIVKILACLLVVCIHFFLYSGFYNEPITTEFGQGAIYLRWIAYCCVPLFMITTGYLMKNKKLSKEFYFGVLRVLIIYLIISGICWTFDYFHYPQKYIVTGGYTVWNFIKGIFSFTDAQYAWYVEYYFTMFLIMPFVNLAWNGLKDKKQKLICVLTVFALTILSQSFFIGFDSATQIRPFPGYFTRCYPIAYYLIGAYIRDFPPKASVVSKLYFAAVYVISLAWVSSTTFQQSLANTDNRCIMLSVHYNDYGSFPVAFCSTALFLLLFDIKSSKKGLNKIIKMISEATFACYLISYVFDTIFYTKFTAKYPTVPERCQHAPSVILSVFGCSMLCALVIQGGYSLISGIIRKSRAKKAAAAVSAQEPLPLN